MLAIIESYQKNQIVISKEAKLREDKAKLQRAGCNLALSEAELAGIKEYISGLREESRREVAVKEEIESNLT